jgi:hypothetical protein
MFHSIRVAILYRSILKGYYNVVKRYIELKQNLSYVGPHLQIEQARSLWTIHEPITGYIFSLHATRNNTTVSSLTVKLFKELNLADLEYFRNCNMRKPPQYL